MKNIPNIAFQGKDRKSVFELLNLSDLFERLDEMNKSLDLFDQNITNNEILKFIKNEKHRLSLSKKDIQNLVKLIKKTPLILKEFNEWKLTEIQEQILIELWYQYNLK